MKISIIMVTLNADRFLRNSIESVISQDYDDFEYLIIDGCSTDRTLAIVEEYVALEPRLRVQSEPDAGIADAMNKGWQLASGDVVGYLHADDYFADRFVLRRIASAFAGNQDAVWCTGGMRHVDSAGGLLKEFFPRRYTFRRLLRGNIIFHPATFVKREELVKIGGFSPCLKYAMDYDLWLRLGRVSAPLILADILACFRVHGGSISCRYADAAFVEEWQVRTRYLHTGTATYMVHYWYYVLKRMVQAKKFRCLLSREGAESA
jgi:glycosyltransferase involved in cell wall biosynthesis